MNRPRTNQTRSQQRTRSLRGFFPSVQPLESRRLMALAVGNLGFEAPASSAFPTARSFDLGDAGFETDVVGDGLYDSDPTNTAWTFSGNAGVSANNSSITRGNPPAPEGVQVAYLRGTEYVAGIRQTIHGMPAGSYQITFSAAQGAGNAPGSGQRVEAKVDGRIIGTFTPYSTNFETIETIPFTVSQSSIANNDHIIEFSTPDPRVSGVINKTVLIDRIDIVNSQENIDEFSVSTSVGQAGLVGIVPGPDGALWFTDNRSNRIGRIDQSSHVAVHGSRVTGVQE